jgi:arylamine N-acetyltransferase
MTGRENDEPLIHKALLDRVLTKLGIADIPSLDLAGLNCIYAAYCGAVSNDHILKRVWLVGDRSRPIPGGDPTDFFSNWLDHGTGGTCFAANGALCALLHAIGFDAWRISGAVLMDGIEHDGNHGSVVATLDGVNYLVDAQLASFAALPLRPGQAATTGDGIHDIRALPTPHGFDISWFPGANRERPLTMRPDLGRGAVSHEYFLNQYALSAARDRRRSPFNEALFVGRHFPGSILILSRGNKIEISRDNKVDKREITLAERARVLIEELGISERIASAIPPDEP